MKAPKIIPIGTNILIKVEKSSAGGLNLDSMKTAIEVGEVMALPVGMDKDIRYNGLKVGDKIHFKAWSTDIVSDNGEQYYYIDMETGGVKGIIK